MEKFLKKYQAQGIQLVLEQVYGLKEKQSKQFIDTVEDVFA